jgi:hypothetical protein
MRAVFWKEMRENLRWAVPAFVAMAATLISVWRNSPLVFDSNVHGHNVSVLWTGMVAAFTAIVFGILQTRRDKRPSSRALLLHRGITTDAAFAGKLLASSVLYSFAVFVPLLAMALFIAVNGIEHKAASPMSLMPTALQALSAFAFWPAVVLVVQRNAKIFGSRLLPVVPTLMTVFLFLAPAETCGIWLIFLSVCTLNLVLALLAARSVFTNVGPVATGIGRGALTVTVTIALLVVFVFVASIVDSYRIRSQVRSRATAVNCHHEVQLGPKGQPWLGRKDYSPQDGTYPLTLVAKMSAGHSVRDRLQPIPEGWQRTPYWLIDQRYFHIVRAYWDRFTPIGDASALVLAGFVQRRWVFDHKDDVILVYHLARSGQWQLARRLPAPSPVGSFGELRKVGWSDKDGNFTLTTSTGAFYLPGDGSAVITMYEAPNSLPIQDSIDHTHDIGHTHPSRVAREEDEPFSMMLRLADRVILLESNLDETAASQATLLGKVGSIDRLYATEIPLPSELAEPKSLGIARDPLQEGTFLALAQSGAPSECHILWTRFDANGQIDAQQEYVENTGVHATHVESTASGLVPPGVWATFMIAVAASDDFSIEKAWGKAWGHAKEDPAKAARTILLFLLPSIVGVPLALLAARRRRLDKRQTWLGIAWGFLMGPAGSLSILAVYPRIVRERCTSCRKPTRIDREQCEHCGHSADDVPRIGIEIFDRDTAAAPKPPETISSR